MQRCKVENEKDPYKYLQRFSFNPNALYFGVNNLLEINGQKYYRYCFLTEKNSDTWENNKKNLVFRILMSQEENNIFGSIGENKLQRNIRIIPVELGNNKGGILVIRSINNYSIDDLWNRLSELFSQKNSNFKEVSINFVNNIVLNYNSNIKIINKYYQSDFIDYLPNMSRVAKLLSEFQSPQKSQVLVGNQNPVINTQIRSNSHLDSTY